MRFGRPWPWQLFSCHCIYCKYDCQYRCCIEFHQQCCERSHCPHQLHWWWWGGATAGGGSTRPGSGSGSGDHLENTHFNAALFGTYKASSIKSRALRQRITNGEVPALPPSKQNAAKPVCLAWHTKGRCNSLCPLSFDHIAYTAEEYAPLATWCRDHGYASL